MPQIPFCFIASLITITILYTVFPVTANGEINLVSNLYYLNTSAKTTNKATNEIIYSNASQFRQLYYLDVSRAVTPTISIRGGGNFEQNDTWAEQGGSNTDTGLRALRPFVELNMDNPMYTVGAGYRKSDIRNSGSGIPATRDVREEYNALLGWRPVDLPRVRMNYNLANVLLSRDPDSVDTREDVFRLDTYYELKGLALSYVYTYDNLKDSMNEISTLTRVQDGRAEFSRGFFDSRLSLNALYTINRTTKEFSGSGASTIKVFPAGGLFSLNAIPGIGPALDPDPALIDGNPTDSAGIDLGTSGDQVNFANIGVDLGFTKEVDTVFLWVDKSLTSDIARSFSWEVYTSPDNGPNSMWTSVATVFPAAFGTFQNRFEISFPVVQTRFIKVVTRALSPFVIGASEFTHINVTEMETLVTRRGQGGQKFKDVNQDYSMGLKWRVSDKTTVGYNLYYTVQESDPLSTRNTSLANSVDINHFFSSVFAGNARLQRSDQKDTGATTTGYNYAASLRAAYLPTFTQILSYTGAYTEENTSTAILISKNNSVLLRNVAQLYSGWSLALDVGYSRNAQSQGSRTDSTLMRAITSVVPNDKITFNLDYSVTWSNEYKIGGESRTRLQTLDVSGNIVPAKNLSFYGRISVNERPDRTQLFQNYAVNWSPFQGGGLQFLFNYNEVFRSEENTTETTIGPGMKLDINHRIICEASYQWNKTDSDLAKEDFRIFSSNVKVLF